MAKDIFIDTEVFTEIEQGIISTAEICKLEEAEVGDARLVGGTNIMSALKGSSMELNELMDKYKGHSMDVLPQSLDNIKQSHINADKSAANAIGHMFK